MSDNGPGPEDRLAALAASVTEGSAVDWDALERAALSPEERQVVTNLRTVAEIARVAASDPEAPDRLDAGTTWEHLQILGDLGSGCFGRVYRAWDPGLEREVALKLLRRSPAELDLTATEEGRLLARVRHPNVVTVYGAGLADGRLGIWMEKVAGRTLEQILEMQGPFGAREAALIGLDLCQALAAVHAVGLIHRDVKAQNVIREEGGRIVLMDFGLVRFVSSSEPTRLAGTPMYVAPELLAGKAPAPATDIYSVGVLLFHLVTRAYPRDPQNQRVLLRDVRPDLPDGFVQVVERALAADPQQRFPTAGAFEAALAASLGLGSPPVAAASEDVAAIEPADRLEYLERAASDIAELSEQGPPDDDRLLNRLSDFIAEGTHLCEQLINSFAARSGRAGDHALVLSLSHLAEGVQRELRAHGFAEPPLEGYLFHLDKAVCHPVRNLLETLDARTAQTQTDDDFFVCEAPRDAEQARMEERLQGLRSGDDLARHDAVVDLATRYPEALAEWLERQPAAERDVVLQALWLHADLLLLEARARARPVVEAAARMATDSDLRQRWELLRSVFFGSGNEDVGDPAVAAMEAETDSNRRLFGRTFLCHPSEILRRKALAILDPSDYWEVITQPETPPLLLLEIWRAVKSRVDEAYQKVFFVCARDKMLRLGDPERLRAVVELVKEFYFVDVFHENTFFRMLVDLDERVRIEGQRHRLLIDFDTGYVETLRQFLAGGSRRDQPIDDWRGVPLPIQRKVARLGYFLKHFACHPIDPIAHECLAHLRVLGDVTDYLVLPAINARLLAELAKEKHLFRREEARYALVSNPKTSAHVIAHHIRLLRPDCLRRLIDNRQSSQFARNLAQQALRVTRR